ncbi:MAG TPA: hypothetical protein DIW17_03210 [Clostridiales bacterium]|jgi:stage V sporulation protein SpoVS|nr:stage V sporulation protein S [Clostridia bacterium]HCS72866.1 hypothetical protein [Clostridiales bacterium]
MEEIILKIGKNTNHVWAAKSITENVAKDVKVSVDAIGLEANYIAVKTFIQAKEDFSSKGINVSFSPAYVVLITTNGSKTAVRWDVIITR